MPGSSAAFKIRCSLTLTWGQTGSIEWIHQFGTIGGSTDLAHAVATDVSGNVFVVGQVFGALPGQTSAGGGDAFVRKYDASGTQVWTRQFGTSLSDQVLAVSVDAAGRVYTGGVVGTTLPGQTSAGQDDAFVRTYDRDGNAVWTIQFGSTQRDSIGGISVHESGEVVLGHRGRVGEGLELGGF